MAKLFVEGYVPEETKHCVSGSMVRVYRQMGSGISEDMLLGIGQGVGYIYWHQKGCAPFLGGRTNPRIGMEALAGKRTGVRITKHVTTSKKKASMALFETLNRGKPLMAQVDMGFLPYLNLHGGHFGGHSITVWGYNSDDNRVLVADRDTEMHSIPLEALEKARSSQYRPFPPQNAWWEFEEDCLRLPTKEEVRLSVAGQCDAMLDPPVSNMGVPGIEKTASMVSRWPAAMTARELRGAMFSCNISISADGGTGGGIFRKMFAGFLEEAAELLGDGRVADCSIKFMAIAEKWEGLASLWEALSAQRGTPAAGIGECVSTLRAIALMERDAWTELRKSVPQP